MILRTWGCLNRRCRNEWTADGDHPACPKCGALKVKWIPGGFAIMKKAPGYDRTIKTLTDRAGMTNMNDPVAGYRAKGKPDVPQPVSYVDAKVGGFAGKVGLDAAGRPMASCVANGMSDRIKVQTGRNFTDTASVPVRQGDRIVQRQLTGPNNWSRQKGGG